MTRLGEKSIKTYRQYNIDPVKAVGTDDPRIVGPEVRKWLVDYMTTAPLVRMVVEGVHAVDMVRKIVGPTMPYLADMGTIRGDYSADSPAVANSEKRAVANLVHASETPDEAMHEIEYWFGKTPPIFQYKRYGVNS